MVVSRKLIGMIIYTRYNIFRKIEGKKRLSVKFFFSITFLSKTLPTDSLQSQDTHRNGSWRARPSDKFMATLETATLLLAMLLTDFDELLPIRHTAKTHAATEHGELGQVIS